MADDQRLTRQRIAWEGSEQQHLGYVGKRGELAVDSLLQHYVFYTAAVAVIAESAST